MGERGSKWSDAMKQVIDLYREEMIQQYKNAEPFYRMMGQAQRESGWRPPALQVKFRRVPRQPRRK